MFIVGAGAAYPQGVLSNEHLSELGVRLSKEDSAVFDRFGVQARRSTLTRDFLSKHSSPDVLESRAAAVMTPTQLAVEAAKQAMDRACITTEQVGLIIADCATPYQTCPSEAQRLGGSLGLKVPAYDISAGASAFALSLDVLSSWREDRLPDYVLCVSTNVPTQLIQYSRDPLAAYLFGDAASAMIVSPRVKGRLGIRKTYLERVRNMQSCVSIKRSISVSSASLLKEEELKNRVSAALLNLGAKKGAYIVGPQLYGADLKTSAPQLSIPDEKLVVMTAETGYALGSSSGCAVASLWEKLKNGDQVAVIHDGDGISAGVLLEAA